MISFDNLGIKHVHICSGKSSALELEGRGLMDDDYDPIRDAVFVELSWGSDDHEEFEFAVNTTGPTVDAAIAECAIFLYELVQNAESNEKERTSHGVWGVWQKYGPHLINWIVDSQNKIYHASVS